MSKSSLRILPFFVHYNYPIKDFKTSHMKYGVETVVWQIA